jgi:hypothetical protein
MGGLLVHVLAVVPAEGESAQVDGLKLTAMKVNERCVCEVKAEVLKKKRAASEFWRGRGDGSEPGKDSDHSALARGESQH